MQVSLLKSMRMEDHLKIAEVLSPLRQNNVLIIGSGFATHSIGQSNEPAQWAKDFKVWLNDVLTNKSYSPTERKAMLLDYVSPRLYKGTPYHGPFPSSGHDLCSSRVWSRETYLLRVCQVLTQ